MIDTPQILFAKALTDHQAETILEVAPCGFVITDRVGLILWANRRFRSWCGPDAWESRSLTLRNFLTPAGRIYAETHLEPLLAMQGFVNEIALDLIFGDRLMPVLANIRQETPSKGSPYRIVTLFDARDRRKYETALLEARRSAEQANQALAERNVEMQRLIEELKKERDAAEQASTARAAYFATLSHELRTPLNAIIGFSSLINSGRALTPEKVSGYSGYIETGAQHLLTLVNDILEFIKLDLQTTSLRQEQVAVREALILACQMLEPKVAEKQITVTIDHRSPDTVVWADATRLHQVLINLLSNAVKFTPPGGTIVASFGPSQPDRCEICIRDTGVGIAAEYLEHVFDPFAQVGQAHRQEGTGLGLPICRRLLTMMGGSIQLTSDVGRGTMATINLPASSISLE